jgi:hypothetical protein
MPALASSFQAARKERLRLLLLILGETFDDISQFMLATPLYQAGVSKYGIDGRT